MEEFKDIPNEKIKACGILVKNSLGQILVFARRGNKDDLGIIAGGRENGETLAECAERELKQETGIEYKFGSNPAFTDKPSPNKDVYCATFVIESDFGGPLPEVYEGDVYEGYAFWADPKSLLNEKSEFMNYNLKLLTKAGLI